MRKYSLLHRRAHHTDIYLIFVPVILRLNTGKHWSLCSWFVRMRPNQKRCQPYANIPAICVPISVFSSRSCVYFSFLLSCSTMCASCHLRHSPSITPNRISLGISSRERSNVWVIVRFDRRRTLSLPHALYARIRAVIFVFLFFFRFRCWCWNMCKRPNGRWVCAARARSHSHRRAKRQTVASPSQHTSTN